MNSMKKKINSIIQDKDGSETLEMVYGVAVMIAFVLVAIMFMSYIFAASDVNLAVRRICRDIEVSGQVKSQAELDRQFKSYLSGEGFKEHKIEVKQSGHTVDGQKLDFLSIFEVYGHCEFTVPLINPGNFTGYKLAIPISIRVTGMTEVEW